MSFDPCRAPDGLAPSLQQLIASASRRPSGLLVPPAAWGAALARDQDAAGPGSAATAVPPDVLPPWPALVLPASARPRTPEGHAEAMMFCAPTASDLDLPEPTLPEIVKMLRAVPFQPAMLLCSLVAAVLFHHPRDRDRHLALSEELHKRWLAQRMRRFLAEDESHLLFDERHVAALQRLLVTHAAPEPARVLTRGLTTEEIGHVMGALLAMASVLPQLEPPLDPDVPPAELTPDQVVWPGWASFTVRAGAWYDEPYIAEAMARAHAFYVDVHGSEGLAGHAARIDIEAWVADGSGLSMAQQLAGALAPLERGLRPVARADERVKLLMTIPGVAELLGLTWPARSATSPGSRRPASSSATPA